MNCGVFVSEKGTTSTFTALLSKRDVLDVQGQQAYGQGEFTRMVGDGFLDNLEFCRLDLFKATDGEECPESHPPRVCSDWCQSLRRAWLRQATWQIT